jgi:hypothetical protein
MPSPNVGRLYFDLGMKIDHSDMGNGDVVKIFAPVPVDCVVKSIYLREDVKASAGTIAVQSARGTVDTSLLTASTYNLATPTANIGTALVLAAAPALKLKAGDSLRAVWTFTTAGSVEGCGCIVEAEPATW